MSSSTRSWQISPGAAAGAGTPSGLVPGQRAQLSRGLRRARSGCVDGAAGTGRRLLVFTDGVVEHRGASGEMFGEQRLAEWLLRHLSKDLPDAEVLRRLNRDLLAMIGEAGPSDDATLVLVHWLGGETMSAA